MVASQDVLPLVHILQSQLGSWQARLCTGNVSNVRSYTNWLQSSRLFTSSRASLAAGRHACTTGNVSTVRSYTNGLQSSRLFTSSRASLAAGRHAYTTGNVSTVRSFTNGLQSSLKIIPLEDCQRILCYCKAFWSVYTI